MRPLLFASRLAFICNCLFLVCVAVQQTHDFIGQKDLAAIVIVLGWLVAPFQNIIVNIWYGTLLLNKSPKRLPNWLSIANLAILLVQLFVYFILPK